MEYRNSFVIYSEWKKLFEDLTLEETRILLMRIFEYNEGIDKPSENRVIEIAFKLIKATFDKDYEKYQKTVKSRSEAGKKSAEAREGKTQKNPNSTNSTNVNKSQQKSTNSTVYDNDNDYDYDYDNVREKKKEKKIQKKKTENFDPSKGTDKGICPSEAQKEGQSNFECGGTSVPLSQKKVFVIPTIQEIEAYCLERKNNVDASQFFDFYTSKDWFIGKNKMRDWKASVRTWERKDKKPDLKPLSNDQKQQLEYYKSKIKMNPNAHVPEFFKQYLSQ